MRNLCDIEIGSATQYAEIDGGFTFPFNYHNVNYSSRIDIKGKTYARERDEDGKDFPTVTELVEGGRMRLFDYKKTICYEPSVQTDPDFDEIVAYFKKGGLNVSREALEHNYNAWRCDLKSGYRDEANGTFVFTPCGCNSLSFTVTELCDRYGWQETYEA